MRELFITNLKFLKFKCYFVIVQSRTVLSVCWEKRKIYLNGEKINRIVVDIHEMINSFAQWC